MSHASEINQKVRDLEARVAELEGLASTYSTWINDYPHSFTPSISRDDTSPLPTDVTERQRFMLRGTQKIFPGDNEARTIDSAPDDGSNILAKIKDHWYIVHWEEYDESTYLEFGERGYWTFSDPRLADELYNAEFLHWIPLPDGEPPAAQK